MKKVVCFIFALAFFIPLKGYSQTIADTIGQFAHDQKTATVEASLDKAWDAAESVLKKEGRITDVSRQDGEIEAAIGDKWVEVELEAKGEQTEVKVSCRNNENKQPDLELAQKLLDQITKTL